MKKRAVISVNLAVFLFGTAGLFAKWISLPAIGITFGRVFFSSLSLLVFILCTRQPLRVRRRHAFLLVLAGGLLAVHWWLFLLSIQLSTVAVGTITFSAFPLFVTFLEPLAFHEKLRAGRVVSALLILLGVLLTVPQFTLENHISLGIAVGLISALAYSILTLLNRYFMQYYSGTVTALYEQGSAALLLLPSLFWIPFSPTVSDWAMLAFLGIMTTALAHTLFISSLKVLPAQVTGVVSSMESVYGILLALLVLGETPTLHELAGAAVIIIVVIVSQLWQKPQNNAA
ncbi:MAG TPA: DMT family transporter [Candidatus Gallacutalibacter pullistercoris]|nr:DMT family transporter [Candidatus Gallacutalibacter pullistercoris]